MIALLTMRMNAAIRSAVATLILSSVSLSALQSAEIPWTQPLYQVEGISSSVPVVRIERKTETAPDGQITDWFTFRTEQGARLMKYTRYQRNGQPALVGDMGLGLQGEGTAWYANNTIRLILNGEDFTARLPATIEVDEAVGLGRVHLTWQTDEFAVSLIFGYPSDGAACYVEGLIEPRQKNKSPRVQVALIAMPGSLTGYMKRPYHRWVLTGDGRSVEVAPPKQENTFTVNLAQKNSWIFFADRYNDPEIRPSRWCYGPCALIVLPEERPSAKVLVTSYPVNTLLTYPAGTRRFRLALLTFEMLGNDLGLRILKEVYSREAERLRHLPSEAENVRKPL